MTVTDAGPRPATNWMPADLVVVAHGPPATQGNKTAYAKQGKDGKMHVRVVEGRRPEARQGFATWRETVRAATVQARSGRPPLEGPLVVALTLTVPRPQLPARKRTPFGLVAVRHYPHQRPDVLKLARAVEDAITLGLGWKDDAQIVHYVRLGKFYAGDGDTHGEPDVLDHPGVVVRVWAATT